MGYDIHVTRQRDGDDIQRRLIEAAEWLNYIESDSELALQEDGQRISALWTSYGKEGVLPCFIWWRGIISTKNPNRKVLIKALEIASRLEARVIGDDAEEYQSAEDLQE